jgi:hypothetical protein
MNKFLTRFFVLSICILALTFAAAAQRRKTPVKTPPKPKVVTTNTIAKPEVKSGAEKVSIQIKNSTKFLYLLGGVARVIEDLDREIAAGKASKNAPGLNAKNKGEVMQSLRNLRAGLVQLEIDFRVKPELKAYLPQIQGISDMSARAEDLANGGQFIESGKVLIIVVEKLADTLAAMP